jgi:hypothetical protein
MWGIIISKQKELPHPMLRNMVLRGGFKNLKMLPGNTDSMNCSSEMEVFFQ